MKRSGPLLALLLGVAVLLPGAVAAEVYVIQLASVRSSKAANNEWTRLQKMHPGLLGDMKLTLQKVDLGERGIFFRIQTGPFPNQTTAEDMCWQLRTQDLQCLVVRR